MGVARQPRRKRRAAARLRKLTPVKAASGPTYALVQGAGRPAIAAEVLRAAPQGPPPYLSAAAARPPTASACPRPLLQPLSFACPGGSGCRGRCFGGRGALRCGDGARLSRGPECTRGARGADCVSPLASPPCWFHRHASAATGSILSAARALLAAHGRGGAQDCFPDSCHGPSG
jgi:hypothetical protein